MTSYQGPIYEQELKVIRAWINNHIHCYLWDILTQPFPTVNVILAKLTWSYVMVEEIHPKVYMDSIIYPYH